MHHPHSHTYRIRGREYVYVYERRNLLQWTMNNIEMANAELIQNPFLLDRNHIGEYIYTCNTFCVAASVIVLAVCE